MSKVCGLPSASSAVEVEAGVVRFADRLPGDEHLAVPRLGHKAGQGHGEREGLIAQQEVRKAGRIAFGVAEAAAIIARGAVRDLLYPA